MQAISIRTHIPASRKIKLSLPSSVPTGETGLIVVIDDSVRDSAVKRMQTARKLINSRLFGLWKNRKDIRDPIAYARSLRIRAEARHAHP